MSVTVPTAPRSVLEGLRAVTADSTALGALGSALCRWRWFVLLALCAGSVAADVAIPPADTDLFIRAGQVLLSPAWADAFADKIIQAGPAQLAFYGLAGSLEQALGLTRFEIVSVLLQFGVVFGTVWLVRSGLRRADGRTRPGVELAAGVLAVLLGFGSSVYLAGHPAQFTVPALWLFAARQARDGKGWQSGALLGLTLGWEVWGALGAPVLLLLPTWRQRLLAASAFTGVVAATFGPFLVAGTFAMHRYEWIVNPQSTVAPLVGADGHFGWELRLLQGGFALAVGAAVAVRLRATPHSVWAVPLAAAVARLLFDPLAASYYWVAPGILALVGAAVLLAVPARRPWLVAAALYPLALAFVLPQWIPVAAIVPALWFGVRPSAAATPVEAAA